MKKETAKIIRKALPLFLLIFMAVGSILGSAGVLVYRSIREDHLAELMTREARAVNLENSAVLAELEEVVSDVRFLAGQNELIRLLDSGDPGLLPDIQAEYLRMATVKPAYDQIRFLDSGGMEIVRVNNDEAPLPVPADKLRDKGNRYYFIDAFALGKDAVYASPLDLNKEDGLVEFPMKPTIRIGTPVFDSAGTKHGVLMVNYKAAELFDLIETAGKASIGEKMLVNPDGYWLLGPVGERAWGFMFKDLETETFARDYPEEWEDILTQCDGQFLTANGLFTFATLYPLQQGEQSSCSLGAQRDAKPCTIAGDRYFWVLISRVPPGTIHAHSRQILSRLLLGGGALFLFMLAGGAHLSIAITRRKEYQEQLVKWALYDALTGLANRKLFFDRLGAGISMAKRHGRRLGLLYIDLDGFKAVNDTYGHEAGDDLLVQVARRLQAVIRQSDTAARLGGDEFAVILAEIDSADGAFRVGEKIIAELSRPIDLKGTAVTVGASIGLAVYPDHGDTPETLVHGADKAMYESKARGKNRCTAADELDG